jgi:hypothetical protein
MPTAAPPGLDFCYFDLVGAMCEATDVSGQYALHSFLVGQRLFRGGTFAPRSENQMVSSITVCRAKVSTDIPATLRACNKTPSRSASRYNFRLAV